MEIALRAAGAKQAAEIVLQETERGKYRSFETASILIFSR